MIPSDFLKPIVIVMLIAITLYTVFRKNWGSRSTFQGLTRGSSWIAVIAAVGLGFYDGFFGPGTGSFLIFVFLMLGFDFVIAAGNAKVLNFGSNVASLSTFMLLGQVNYRIGIPMGMAMVCGSLLVTDIRSIQSVRESDDVIKVQTVQRNRTLYWDEVTDNVQENWYKVKKTPDGRWKILDSDLFHIS